MTVEKKDISHSLASRYKASVEPKSWILPNRVRFSNWIDKTFKYSKRQTAKCSECEEGESCPAIKVSSTKLFAQQDFIKDYMQFNSPYRGLLVYHGLGSGKTCSSIAAAEILMNHMNVVVMLPASLRDNFINEIQKCGSLFFLREQHWVFSKTLNDERLKITQEFMKKQKGVWIPVSGKPSNFHELKDEEKRQIDVQVLHMIEQRYEFINYNGLRESSVRKMIVNDKNPFDNKTIIVDEIHNLISRIVNGRKIGNALYKLLMSAKNAKLILLSGTPIINYPHEVAYIMNLLAGPQIYYELKTNKGSPFSKEEIDKVLEMSEYVDDYSLDVNNQKITISLVPNGFHVVDRKNMQIARTETKKISERILDDIIETLKKSLKMNISKRMGTKEYRLFPEKKEEFDELFVNEARGTVKNERLFMRRALGLVSYYNVFDTELFPRWNIQEIGVEMTDNQFALYEKARAQERKQESSSSKKKKGNNDSSSQVYRFFSRAVCNFVFPEKIKRPFPSKMSDMRKELDEDDVFEDFDKIDKKNDDEDATDSKAMKNQQYQKELEKCLTTLRTNNMEYLASDKIERYSPKIKKIIDGIHASPGNVLVYSQFRKVEGLGVLCMSLDTHGWTEFKVKLVDGIWTVDVKEEDMYKPMYAAFTGNNDESRILLKIFNNDLKLVPESITKVLKGKNNLRGGIIKVMMITQSGAEGISLKNTRQVHIMEPYWNHIRMDQVIGRAIRACSHVTLPPNERHVDVYIYYSTLSKSQKESSFTIRTKDKSVSSDEYLFNIAKTKKAITDGLLNMMQRASVDCAMHAKHHSNMKCFAFPVNMDENRIIKHQDIKMEEEDVSYNKNIEENQWDGQLLRTKKGNFVIKTGTNEVYDYDIYLESGKIVKIGVIEYDEITKTRKIKMVY